MGPGEWWEGKDAPTRTTRIQERGRRHGLPVAPALPVHADQAVKLLPQPQPPVALGLLNVKPEPCMDDT